MGTLAVSPRYHQFESPFFTLNIPTKSEHPMTSGENAQGLLITSESTNDRLYYISCIFMPMTSFTIFWWILLPFILGSIPLAKPPAGAGLEADHDQAASNKKQRANRTSVHHGCLANAFGLHLAI